MQVTSTLNLLLFLTPIGHATIPLDARSTLAETSEVPQGFTHPGALHTLKDFERIKKHLGYQSEPWYTAWKHLERSKLAQAYWEPSPHEILVRGDNGIDTPNFEDAYRDAHAAYQLTLRWHFSGDTSFADAAAAILDSWSSTLTDVTGNEDKFLAAGLYGYQFANVAEILRGYKGWPEESQSTFGAMLNDIFGHYNRIFLDEHYNKPDFYYANWDLCNIASLMAIGIFNDNSTMYDFAVEYFLNGPVGGEVANGALPFFSIANFTEPGTGKVIMQGQEAGRDQAHSLLCFSLLAVIGQQGYNQGVDLYSTFGNMILNGAEYAAKYNVNETVPYTPYESWEGVLEEISPKARFDVRPGFEAIYSHYAELKGVNASWSEKYRDYVNGNLTENIEGGGGDYSPRSGGFDYFGHGTLMYRLGSD